MTANPMVIEKVIAIIRILPLSTALAPVIVMTKTLIRMTATIVIAHLSSPKLGIGWDRSNPMFDSRWRRPSAVLSQ